MKENYLEWFDVKDKLPPFGDLVLAIDEDELGQLIFIAKRKLLNSGVEIFDAWEDVGGPVTVHRWAHIPLPDKEVKSDT